MNTIIIDPKTNTRHTIFESTGKILLKQYILCYLTGYNNQRGGGDINNLCQEQPTICSGNLGVSRKNMPQITSELSVIRKLLKKHISGVLIRKTEINISELEAGKTLIPIQNQLSSTIIKRICSSKNDNKHDENKKSAPIFIKGSNTPTIYYILDGHHRRQKAIDEKRTHILAKVFRGEVINESR